MRQGVFITLEGGEGVGKSTQLRLLADALRSHGQDVLATREPGGSDGAEALRSLLLFGDAPLTLRAEILAHFAARFDHVERVIRPALAAGQVVLCDRFTDSTLAYQGYGRAHGDAAILELIHVLDGQLALRPDRTFLLEAPREIARQRLAIRKAPTDRYEQADEAFHARVIKGFQDIAVANPQRVRRIGTAQIAVEGVNSLIMKEILAVLSHG
ncbi:MAG: dTMP kinase [Acetobacter sp.]